MGETASGALVGDPATLEVPLPSDGEVAEGCDEGAMLVTTVGGDGGAILSGWVGG